MSTLLRDIFTIPETTSTADYVLRLTESVDDAHLAHTLDDYVVTEELATAFDRALGVVNDAIATNTSKGAFLTGSFGSGKSHFMAVLYALLRQHPKARAIPELSAPIARHDPQLQSRTVLPLTFHLLGAHSLEQALFDGYLRQIGELHPDATPPLLHQTARLLEDADALRARIGDEAFFGGLNEGTETADPWSAVLGGAATWDAASYDAARAASIHDPHRAELVSTLQERYFSSYSQHASHVGLDEGLTAISAHAQSLGYDAVVLFLDELVLWLAFRIRDHAFFGAEAQKISKLVEGGQGGRRVPLVSFIARQMDLRRWLADSGASGAEQQALEQAFRFQEGRFPEIRLGDDNLPYVASKRLLAPRSEEAARGIDRAFAALDRQAESWDVLLDGVNTDDRHRGADAKQFRLTYPFSPALVSTLRSLAGVMQRERTALKVMQQLLVDRRDALTIDDVIPVGDAFDYLVSGAAGDQPLDEASAALFRAASALYEEKLLPMILEPYGLTAADLVSPTALPPAAVGDLRLAKTLLLSSIAPNVPALKSLTASRLASLNHGSIRSPLPNGEASVVLSKVRQWAAQAPEIRVETEGRNPLITVQLSDVDYESVVDRARGEDNDGRRRDLIKKLVAEDLGLGPLGMQDPLGAYHHKVVWRGTPRTVDMVFGNVRDPGWLSDDHFRSGPDRWRFVIDHPFDDPGRSAAEDLARIDSMRVRNWDERTIVWLPRFFSEERMRDVSRLVVLNYLLEGNGDRYEQHADHLSELGRVQAKTILQSQREALLHRVRQAIQVAYDVESPAGGNDVINDAAHPDVLASLTPSFTPRPSAGGTLRQAFEYLVREAFSATYPAHPQFDPGDQEVRVRDLQVTYGYIEQALADPQHRVPLGPDLAAARRIANPLGVGKATETHFLMGDDYFAIWGPEFERRLGSRNADNDAPVLVSEMRGWIAAMEPKRGLTREVADLVILAWAALRRRAWYQFGNTIDTPRPGALRDDMELRVQPMPTEQEWVDATRLAGAVFGVSGTQYATPAAVARLADDVRANALKLSDPASRLVTALEGAAAQLRLDGGARLATARLAAELCDSLRSLHGLQLIRRLATTDIAEPTKLGRSLTASTDVARSVSAYDWTRFAPLASAASGEGARADDAARVLAHLRKVLLDDEFITPLVPALRQVEDQLFHWLTAATPVPSPTEAAAQPDPVAPASAIGRARICGSRGVREVTERLQLFVAEHPEANVVVEWRIE